MEALIDKAESREQKAKSRKQKAEPHFSTFERTPQPPLRYPQTSFFFIVNLTSIQFL